jgi:PKD repeat protein/glucose/arabinose dehydrogenase/type 1 glutamine amidotransferase
LRRLLAATTAAVLGIGLACLPGAASAADSDPAFKALVFSKTAGFRHDSIPDGIAAIEKLGAEHNFTVDATEDAGQFTDANLAQYDVVIWLSTTGDVLNDDQQAAFERYIEAGGGYAGVHAAADTEYDWPFYGGLVGAYFLGHPAQQNVTIKTEDRVHPSTAHLPAVYQRFDELYNYRTNPRDKVHVLQSYDESSYTGGTMGADHPITWCQDFQGGRSWYTGMGHTKESYSEPGFLQELLGGIRTAAGVVKADCGATQTASFDKVTLDDGTQNPMDLDIAPDGRVFYLERDGRLQVIKPGGGTVTAGRLDVTTVQEFGLLGIELAPDFETSHQLYLYYSPDDGTDHDRVSRFTMNGDTLDLSSEKVVLDVPTQRAQCCHAGGALQFDTKGNLYIAIGDNTNPFASDGYTPIDERPGREAWDAQRTSGNTNDLRGKVLRIHPEADGSYTIPAGNLFPAGTPKTKPEIYAMGFRNPFKIGMDPRTDTVLVGNYGPDAGSANPDRGPDGRVEWDALSKPGNYGWPYCVGANTPYNDYDFATGVSGPKFDCAGGPTNDSPNNTGMTKLPPAIAADVWYGYSTNPEFPEIGGGGAPMAGSVYTYDPASTSERKWPAYWDGKAIFGEWNQGKLYSFQLQDGTDELTDINRILPGMTFLRPHAMEWGPDGALYLIEWGSGFGGNNADSGVYRIDYVQGNRSPIAKLQADKTSGPLPLTVHFDSAGSRDPDGTPVTLAWDFDGDGTTDSTEPAPTHVYDTAGNYSATLTVTDADGKSATASEAIAAGNTAPTVTVQAPPDGGFFEFGDQVHYKVTVTDPEDGTVDCDDVVAQPALGHDQHAHPYGQYTGCEGTVTVPGDDGHLGADIFGVITFTYTDKGAPGVDPLTSQKVVVLQPKRKQAEYFADTGRVGSATAGDPGVRTETTGDTAGGHENIGWIEDGDWWSFDPTNLTGIDSIRLRAASPGGGGHVEIRQGSPTGTLVGAVDVPSTGGWQTYKDVTTPVSGATADSGPLYFVATKGGLNVNWVDFVGKGVTDNQRPALTVDATPVKGTAPLKVDFSATATDPEGDTPIGYAWTFGDGGTADVANPSHTYSRAGTYTAKVTATDAKGAAATRSIEITVEAQNTVCLRGRSDDFLGTALDTDRWTTVVRANQDLRVADGHLVIPTSSTDIYGAGSGTTPNIVLQDLPDGPFQATTKLTLPARDKYQQAGLVVYGDDDNYAKMVFEARGDNDADARIFQFIREEGGVPNEVADSNTANLGAAYPDTVWVRFTSDGSNLRASYSSDGVTFEEMPQTKSLAGITDPKIGLVALQGNGITATPVDARFDWFSIVPDDTANAAGPDDEFDGDALDGCRWNVVRPDPAALRVTGGNLEIDTSPGDIYGAGNSGPDNFVLQAQPDGDWTVETKVDGSAFDERYQQAGLLLYGDDANYVKLDFITDNEPGTPLHRRIELRSEIDDVVQDPQPQADPVTEGVWWLRLSKKGTDLTGSYSSDGTTWTDLGTVSNTAVADTGRIGLFAFGVDQKASKTARFDYFRVAEKDTTPPTVDATLDPAEPDGDAGWYVGPVSVVLTATDDRPGDVLVEYRLDDGAWTAYTGPVRIGEGVHTVDYRATDAAGNASEVQTVRVKRDGTAPAVRVSGVTDGTSYGDSERLTLSWEATDATSGVEKVTATLDGEPVRSGSTVDLYTLSLGDHLLTVTATDKAGNRTRREVGFSVGTSFDDMEALVDRFHHDGRLSDSAARSLRAELESADTQAAKGHRKAAARQLDAFEEVVTAKVRDDEVAAVLTRDADAMEAWLREEPNGSGGSEADGNG